MKPQYSDKYIAERELEDFLDRIHDDQIVESWHAGHVSDAELIARLRYLESKASANIIEKLESAS